MPVLIGVAVAGLAAGVLTGFIWGPIKEIADAVAKIADVVVGQLPDASNLGLAIPSGWVKGYSLLDSFLPLHEALGFVAIILGIVVAGVTWRVAVVVYHLIPKPGTGT
jgi:hypothetical protein